MNTHFFSHSITPTDTFEQFLETSSFARRSRETESKMAQKSHHVEASAVPDYFPDRAVQKTEQRKQKPS